MLEMTKGLFSDDKPFDRTLEKRHLRQVLLQHPPRRLYLALKEPGWRGLVDALRARGVLQRAARNKASGLSGL
jgi:hypothetical protein